MNLQMLKRAMLAYVSAVKFIWSGIAYPLSIVGKKLMNLRGYRVYGKSIQDGTPTPDSPVEIQSVGDLSTKNLFNPATAEYIGCSYNDGIISTTVKENNIDVLLPAGKYTISCESNASVVIRNGKVASGYIVIKQSSVTSVTINFPSDVDGYLRISFYGTTSYIKNLQIEEGTTATDYEPYHKYKIPVVARGKNLFDGSSSEGEGKYLSSTGAVNSGNANLRVTDYITIPSGASSLTFSFKGEVMNYPSMCLYDENKQYITGKMYSGSTKPSISVPSNAKYVRCSYRTVNTDIQLEGGSTKTEYEPYRAPVTTNIFLEEPLRKVGDYADYVDFEKQKAVRNISKYIFTGDENISIRIGEDRAVFYFPQILNKYGNNNKNFIPHGELCNRYQHVENVSTLTPLKISLSDCIYICDYYLTAEEYQAQLKNWYSSESPLIMYYALATPTEETVKLPALPQFKGTTIYEVGTNIKPSGMEVKYC